VTASNFEHLMFAVAIEGSPLDRAAAATGSAPVECDGVSFMTDKQFATGVNRRETDDQ
jgi:hypothetical protein